VGSEMYIRDGRETLLVAVVMDKVKAGLAIMTAARKGANITCRAAFYRLNQDYLGVVFAKHSRTTHPLNGTGKIKYDDVAKKGWGYCICWHELFLHDVVGIRKDAHTVDVKLIYAPQAPLVCA